jgi:hypothetical protein
MALCNKRLIIGTNRDKGLNTNKLDSKKDRSSSGHYIADVSADSITPLTQKMILNTYELELLDCTRKPIQGNLYDKSHSVSHPELTHLHKLRQSLENLALFRLRSKHLIEYELQFLSIGRIR